MNKEIIIEFCKAIESLYSPIDLQSTIEGMNEGELLEYLKEFNSGLEMIVGPHEVTRKSDLVNEISVSD